MEETIITDSKFSRLFWVISNNDARGNAFGLHMYLKKVYKTDFTPFHNKKRSVN